MQRDLIPTSLRRFLRHIYSEGDGSIALAPKSHRTVTTVEQDHEVGPWCKAGRGWVSLSEGLASAARCESGVATPVGRHHRISPSDGELLRDLGRATQRFGLLLDRAGMSSSAAEPPCRQDGRNSTTRVGLLGGVGLANVFEELEIRRLPNHHTLLLLCRQRCAHPVYVEVQPSAGLVESVHLIVS